MLWRSRTFRTASLITFRDEASVITRDRAIRSLALVAVTEVEPCLAVPLERL
jgi:hypothetical protein